MKAKAQILIVEDERITAEDIQRSLTYLGYTVTSIVSSAKDAINETEKNRPNLILMDIRLRGDVDGVETARQIRARYDIPIVYITGFAEEATLRRAKKTEPFGYLLKPIGEKELQTTIEMALYKHKIERKLKESEERYRLIFDGSRDAIFIAGEDSRFVEVNEAASALTGYSKEELLKMRIPDLHEAKDLHAHKAFFHRIMNGEKITSEAKILRKDGIKVDAEFSNKKIFIGGVAYMHTVARDVTERKRAEEEKERLFADLIQSEKMAGVGTLAGGIAHEFNNLFQIIRGHTEFARETKRPEDTEEAFDTVIHNIDRAAKIVRDLLAFSSQDPSECKSCDVAELIESALSLTEEHFKKLNIKVVRKYGRTPRIDVNRGEIQQVFLNLITNARDTMSPEGGKLVIMVKRIKENVEVKFIDTGKGIKKKNLGKVFEPFYTTKGALGGNFNHQGTGLGLSVSYRIVRNHGGTIQVESKVGRGTTFTVKLPVKRGKAEKRIEEKSEMKEPGSLNILVADDEEEICNMFTKFLSSNGHRVKSALNGKKALDLIGKEYFDIVFLDIIMPGVPTIKVLEKTKEVSPKTEVVMMTGKLMDKDLMNDFKQKGGSSVLKKPFKIDDIMKIIKAWKKKVGDHL